MINYFKSKSSGSFKEPNTPKITAFLQKELGTKDFQLFSMYDADKHNTALYSIGHSTKMQLKMYESVIKSLLQQKRSPDMMFGKDLGSFEKSLKKNLEKDIGKELDFKKSKFKLLDADDFTDVTDEDDDDLDDIIEGIKKL